MLKTLKIATTPGEFVMIQKHECQSSSGPAPDVRPGIVYINGFQSVMAGRKASFLRDWATCQNTDFLTHDHFAHGQSSGECKDATVGTWYRDLCWVLEKESVGPQILVGSSMGFWLALLVILRAKRSISGRVCGVLGIAPSVNFTEKLMREVPVSKLGDATCIFRRPSHYSPTGYYDVPISLVVEGANHYLQAPYEVHCPVSIIYGMQDVDVLYHEIVALMTDLKASSLDVLLVEDGDHRLSREVDLQKITGLLDALLNQPAQQNGKTIE